MARVLVAEDDPEMRALVVQALRKDGHDVHPAVDGADLLAWIAEAFVGDGSFGSIDVVVCDVRMPGHSGLEIVEYLFEARWRIPFVLMTAFGDDHTRRRAERVGAILFDKPLILDELRAAVKQLAPR
jgi:CheY-like chemotaxis protein